MIDGLRVPSNLDADNFLSGLQYKAQPGDIFIATYPKSGTTWMEVIVYSLLNNGKPFDADIGDYLMRTPHLEKVGGYTVSTMVRPGSIKTHLPFDRISYHPQAKYICIIRNPKDVCASFYRFLERNPLSKYFECQFDEFFDDFLKGQVPLCDYFEYLHSLLPYKDRENVLIISYEQMKRDIHCVIRKVAQFLNIELNAQDELLDRVVATSSFEYMKKNFDKARNDFYAHATNDPKIPRVPLAFVQTGNIGGGKSYMSDEQKQQFDKVLAEKMRDMPEFEALWQ
ncbi:unnamed protein product [Rotaria sp. Silwood2]|nr:unnamed protein product [Rotaria sp. Silwood2]CAF3296283.1 unnamed protein product [Rotaria sp. Silwood2]CAF4147699.1 unnamed protein product [Rotaria sp. Silwood2]CAF4238708.1 unnamed protein product [Rotaria sp. Silwood2]